jgi:MFS family permease
VLALVLLAGGTIVTYMQDYLTTYATSTLHMSSRIGFLSAVTVGLFGMAFDPIGGWLSDRFGRKPMMIGPWVLLLAVTVPGFWWVSHHRTAAALVGLSVALAVCGAIATTSTLVCVTESLPAKIRCGALGLIYAFAISVFGGSTQFVVAWLTRVSGSPLAPAWYMTGAVAVALVAMMLTPETAPAKLAATRDA